nr:hypothetical protein [Acidobacteriota bacterium]
PEGYKEAQASLEQKAKAKARIEAINACSYCDQSGFYTVEKEGKKFARKCSHDPAKEAKIKGQN